MSRAILFCTLLIERSSPETVNYKKICQEGNSEPLFSQSSHLGLLGYPSMNHLHGKKIARLEGCLGQVDRVPQEGGLHSLACKFSNAFSKKCMKSWLS